MLLHLTGLAKVTRSTLHCVCSGEQHQKPETSETGTPQVPAADCLPMMDEAWWIAAGYNAGPAVGFAPAEAAPDLISPGAFR